MGMGERVGRCGIDRGVVCARWFLQARSGAVGNFKMVFCLKLFNDDSGGYGSPFVECVRVLDAV